MKKFLNTFMARYKANCEIGYELDKSLMRGVSFQEWKDLLIHRSEKVRQIYDQNEKLIGEMSDFLAKPLDDDSAWELYYGLWDLYYGAYDDLYLMRVMALPLVEYYEKKKDYEKLIFLYNLLGFENFSFYERMIGGDELLDAIHYYQKVIDLKGYYGIIMDQKIRKCFFAAYDNLIALCSHTKEDMADRAFGIYREAISFWQSREVQELDGENNLIREAVAHLQEDILFTEEYATKMTAKQQREFQIIVQEVEDTNPVDSDGSLFRAVIRKRLIDGENPKKLIEELVKHIEEVPEPDYDDPETAVARILDKHNTADRVFDYFNYVKLSDEEKQAFMARFFDKITYLHTHLPFGFWPGTMDGLCVEWYKVAAPHLRSTEEKLILLKKLVISRQPVTYIHEIMVSEIAVRIAKSMIRRHPEFFVGMPGYDSPMDVDKNQDELLNFITISAYLHDVGKCELVEVINRQNRHLSDSEFTMIRKHPEKGLEFLNYDPDFEPHFDIILGHHKTYDGKGGYPASFDKTKSRVECIVDLIMVADCTDAATDILGRNYTKGKNFDMLFKELETGKGTRYNPTIIQLLEEDQALYKDLDYLTGDGRQDIHYRAYMEII